MHVADQVPKAARQARERRHHKHVVLTQRVQRSLELGLRRIRGETI
jgi:hypothetical protein